MSVVVKNAAMVKKGGGVSDVGNSKRGDCGDDGESMIVYVNSMVYTAMM